MACACAFPYQQIRVVNTFIHQPAESDDELDIVKSHTEPSSIFPALALEEGLEDTSNVILSRRSKAAALLQQASNEASAAITDHLSNDHPQTNLCVLNTFIHQTDESEEQDLSSDLVVRSRTEPAMRGAYEAEDAQRERKKKTVRFADVADSIEDYSSDELAMTYTRTLDPFEYSEMGECGFERTADDTESDELPVTSMKTFDHFENAASTLPVLQPVVATVQPVVLLGLGMAGVMLTPAQSCQGFLPSGHVQVKAPERSSPSTVWPENCESNRFTGQCQASSVCENTAADGSDIFATPEQQCIQEELPRLLGTSTRSTALQKYVTLSSPLQVDCLPGSRSLVRWTLDTRKLLSSEKQLLSPEFRIDFPGLGAQPFRLMVMAKQMTRHKGGQTFAKARGHARLLIKCAGSMPNHASRVAFRMTIGDTSRGPFWHQFVEQTCCDLQAAHEDWDLLAAKSCEPVVVCLEVVEFEGLPN